MIFRQKVGKVKMQNNMNIRIATSADTIGILEVYAPYIEQTAITFEYEVPSIESFAQRIQEIKVKYPYIVAELNGEIMGFAYVSTFNKRPACDWTVETSIYLKMNQKRMGLGRKLYDALECILREQGIINLTACIAYPEVEDAHLTMDSIRFHEKLGYKWVGGFNKCGYKFGTWYNLAWMEKHIGIHQAEQEAVKTFDEVRETVKQRYQIG